MHPTRFATLAVQSALEDGAPLQDELRFVVATSPRSLPRWTVADVEAGRADRALSAMGPSRLDPAATALVAVNPVLAGRVSRRIGELPTSFSLISPVLVPLVYLAAVFALQSSVILLLETKIVPTFLADIARRGGHSPLVATLSIASWLAALGVMSSLLLLAGLFLPGLRRVLYRGVEVNLEQARALSAVEDLNDEERGRVLAALPADLVRQLEALGQQSWTVVPELRAQAVAHARGLAERRAAVVRVMLTALAALVAFLMLSVIYADTLAPISGGL